MALRQCQLGALVRLGALVPFLGAHLPPCAHLSVASAFALALEAGVR